MKPRRAVNEGTGGNKAGVIMHFNHYETRKYEGTDHLRSSGADRPVHEVLQPQVMDCVAMSLGSNSELMHNPSSSSCRTRVVPQLILQVYRFWRGISAQVPQTFSPFYLELDALGQPTPCSSCERAERESRV